jgi:(p)ppGpp synthase/HD superfamily hydrolase
MENIFEEACIYASKKHQGQLRKDGTIYILHPFEVALICSSMTQDQEILAAAVLHDVPEECSVTIEEITNLFTQRVGKLVGLETELKFEGISKDKSWKVRKQIAITRLNKTNDIGFKMIYLSDKLANIRALYKDYKQNGIKAFEKFNVKNIDEQLWYYNEVLNSVKELEDYEAYKEYKKLINYIFGPNEKEESI